MRRILLIAVGLTLVVGACGGDDDRGLAQTVTTASTTTTSTTTAPADVDTPTTTTKPASGPRDPQAVLVKLEELPTGWTTAPPDEDDEDSADELDCFEEAASENFDDDDADAEVSYQQSEMGPFIGASLIVEDSAEAAEQVLGLFAQGMNVCNGFTQTEDDGTETTWSVGPLSFPDLGDGTFASRISTMTFFGPFAIDIVVTRVDDAVVFTSHAGIGTPPDPQLTEKVQRLQVDRV